MQTRAHHTAIVPDWRCCQRSSPDWVGPLGEQDILPAAAPAEEGPLLAAHKGAALIRPRFPAPAAAAAAAAAAAVHLPPARDEPRLHAGFRERGRCLRRQLDSPLRLLERWWHWPPSRCWQALHRLALGLYNTSKLKPVKHSLHKAVSAGMLWHPAQALRMSA